MKLKRIKALMLLSELLLVVFMGYWLYSLHNSTRADFRKSLIAQFHESQRKVSDSLLLVYLLDSPTHAKFKVKEVTAIDTSFHHNGKGRVHIEINGSANSNGTVKEIYTVNESPANDSYLINAEQTLNYNETRPIEPGVNIRLVLDKLKVYTDSNKASLFHRDTALFNKAFSEKMKENGWKFSAKWTADSSVAHDNKKGIYIKSEYFTNSYGLEVSHFSWYLFKKMSPQILFTLVLLIITSFAFRLAYKSLKEQIMLGAIKNDFISNMSHELKTPVSTIKVALEALDTYNVIENRETTKEYLEMANMELKRLDLLINQALNTSMLEEGRMALHKEREDLQKLTGEILDVLKMRFTQQHAQVSYRHNGNNFFAQVDKLHIQGVLINILDNSLKYAGEQPAIAVNITEFDKEIRINIADNGPGIPAAYLSKVFEKFFRVPTGNEHSIKGYGLGLSYAAQVMQQHGGSIKAANRPQGGSTFTLTFIKDTA